MKISKLLTAEEVTLFAEMLARTDVTYAVRIYRDQHKPEVLCYAPTIMDAFAWAYASSSLTLGGYPSVNDGVITYPESTLSIEDGSYTVIAEILDVDDVLSRTITATYLDQIMADIEQDELPMSRHPNDQSDRVID